MNRQEPWRSRSRTTGRITTCSSCAETLVSQAMFVDRGERDHAEFLHESWRILLDAVQHAAHATQILADAYIMPACGWGR